MIVVESGLETPGEASRKHLRRTDEELLHIIYENILFIFFFLSFFSTGLLSRTQECFDPQIAVYYLSRNDKRKVE